MPTFPHMSSTSAAWITSKPGHGNQEGWGSSRWEEERRILPGKPWQYIKGLIPGSVEVLKGLVSVCAC